jgi:hypothetical protein
MGDVNQHTFIEQRAAQFAAPYLEVGSRNYGSTQDLRSLFAGRGRYVGVDMLAGRGVDLVLDLTRDFADIDAALEGERFGSIFCLSVLEHCDQPFRMAENLTRLLRAGGQLCVSVPFAWQFHGYPSDYWRFTHEGVKKLFPGLEFNLSHGVAAQARAGEMTPLDEDIGKIPFSPRFHRDRGHRLRGISAGLLRTLARTGVLRWLAGYRYVMAPTMVTMIGVRRAQVAKAA